MAAGCGRAYHRFMIHHPEQTESTVDRVRRETSHEEVARRARELWEQYGRPAGRDEQIWLEAERQLRGLDLTDPKVAARLAAHNGAPVGRRSPGT